MEFLILTAALIFFIEFLILIPVLTILYKKLSRRVSRLEENLGKSHVEIKEKRVDLSSLQKISDQEKGEAEEEVSAYIKKQLDEGAEQDDIFETLLKNGWENNVITEAFIKIDKEKRTEGQQKQEDVFADSSTKGRSPLDNLMQWLVTDWLMKLGALLVLIGLGWFTSYAFLNNWIGPMGRITLGLLVGTSVLLLGEWRIRKFVNQGAVLLSLGATTILITIFAAREIYDFFTPLTALAVIFIAVVFTALSSVRHKSFALAVLSVVLGSIAPLFTNSDATIITMLTYLLIISTGTLWIVAITGWRTLAPLSLTIVIIYSASWISGGIPSQLETSILFFSFAFAALYFATNVVAMIKSTKIKQSDLFVAIANGFLLLWWIHTVAPEVFMSLITAAWALIFAIGAFWIFKVTNRREPFFIYAAVAAAMLAAATAFELSGPALTLAYIFEIGFIVLVANFVLDSARTAQSISLLFIFPAILSIGSIISGAWREGILHGDFFVLLSLAVVLLGLGSFFYSKRKVEHDSPSLESTGALFLFGAIYILILIWLTLHSLSISYDVATTVSLVIYTLIGLFFYIRGQFKDIKAFRNSGAVLLGFVIIRLVFIEVWKLELVGRVIVFILIGTLLISSAFMGRLKDNNPKQENENT